MNFKEMFLVLAISLAITVTNAEYVSYDQYKVYKIVPSSDAEVQILLDVQKSNQYYFWSDVVALNSDVRIMVDPAKQVEFEKYFESVKIPARVVIQDVQNMINEQLQRPATRSSKYAWDYYLSLDEIFAWLDQVVADHPDVATAVTIGTSVEGRPIRGVKIDFKKQANPIIGMIEGGIHAREWISPATVTYIINEFLTSSDPDVKLMAENIVWHIFPVTNPDGYAYTFSDNRMWRKNRSTYNHTSCAMYGLSDDISNGIDLNRNFGFLWMSIGASDIPCAETFAGHVEFSEPESRAIANYVTTIKNEGHMVYYFAFHSYSQMVLVPYSHVAGSTVLEAPNYGDMFEVAIRGMDKLKAVHGTEYEVGTSAEILYPVSGSSFDWVKGVAEIPIVYLFELRDVGEFGFLLPPARIIPNNEEIMAGLIEMEKVTRRLGYYHISDGERVVVSFVLFALALFVAM
uniref:Zinc carboxypeptidase A 1 n=1 Tax=Heliothis virescens TaxID=7102 RepID=A0A2A4J379_HELVI